uniref:Uncharacterized protein n=1 Tax=Arundo donax TaxID=35708 RepID=A0A0A9TTP8_ARUDO
MCSWHSGKSSSCEATNKKKEYISKTYNYFDSCCKNLQLLGSVAETYNYFVTLLQKTTTFSPWITHAIETAKWVHSEKVVVFCNEASK